MTRELREHGSSRGTLDDPRVLRVRDALDRIFSRDVDGRWCSYYVGAIRLWFGAPMPPVIVVEREPTRWYIRKDHHPGRARPWVVLRRLSDDQCRAIGQKPGYLVEVGARATHYEAVRWLTTDLWPVFEDDSNGDPTGTSKD